MSEWTFIDVRDDLRRGWPEPNEDVWVAWCIYWDKSEPKGVCVGFVDDEGVWRDHMWADYQGRWEDLFGVVAWMPLTVPEFPQAEWEAE